MIARIIRWIFGGRRSDHEPTEHLRAAYARYCDAIVSGRLIVEDTPKNDA